MEESQYCRMVALYTDVVYRAALSFSKNPSDAEDVVQNTFLKLLQAKTDFADENHVRKWLIRVTVNECKSLHRSFWKRNISSIEELDQPPSFSSSENSSLYSTVMELPEKYRIVVYLYYYEDYSIKEMADILKITETAIQTRLMRARSKLKEKLEEAWK